METIHIDLVVVVINQENKVLMIWFKIAA